MNLSVALCTYNGAAHLPAQLASLSAQTRRPDELVACDDRSADGTAAILGKFAADALFPVRVHVNDENLGSTRNFERAVGLCTGDIIFLCDQDDIWEPNKLERFEAVFAANPGVGLVASDLAVIAPDGRPTGRRHWANLRSGPAEQERIEAGHGPEVWVRYNTITGAAAAFRADLREIVLPIPACWVHDAWIAFLAAAVSDVRLIREPLVRYRSHASQQIGSARQTLLWQVRSALRMDAGYFAKTAECFEALADRLASIRPRLRDPFVIDLAHGKAAFARTQQRMREGGRIGRPGPVVRRMLAGDYHRYGRGLKGFAADLFF